MASSLDVHCHVFKRAKALQPRLLRGCDPFNNRFFLIGVSAHRQARSALLHWGLPSTLFIQKAPMSDQKSTQEKIAAIGSGIAGIAGVGLSQIDNVSPNLGQAYIIDSFMVVVFGGVGNLWGTLVGAFTLGIANKFLEPYAGAVMAKITILVLIVLFVQKRPQGLFAPRGRSVE